MALDAKVSPPWSSPMFAHEVTLWLKELKCTGPKSDFQVLRSRVLCWCEEQGAASIEEVAECVEFLVPFLEEGDVLEGSAAERIRKNATKVLCSVQKTLKREAERTGGAPGWVAGGAAPSPASAEAPLVGGKAMCPSTFPVLERQRQGDKKKNRLKRGLALRHGSASTPLESGPELEAAHQKLERQLLEEEEAKRNAALESLAKAVKGVKEQKLSTCAEDAALGGRIEELAKAIEGAKAASFEEAQDEVAEAQQEYDKLRLRHDRRCEDAVSFLQYAVEAVRDDKFGDTVRETLKCNLKFARQTDRGCRVLEAAEHIGRLWDEVQMALQVAVTSGSEVVLERAISEAQEAGLPPQHTLLKVAQRELAEVRPQPERRH